MNKQHNPINQQLEKMYELWNQTVDEQTLLARWVLPKDDGKMYELFCQTECTQHGHLDDVTIALNTPFNDINTFSSGLVNDLLNSFKLYQKELEKSGFNKQWHDADKLKAKIKAADKTIFQEALSSFRKAMEFEEDRWLNVALVPQMIFNGMQYTNWLVNILKEELPPKCRLIVLDYIEGQHLRRVTLEHPAVCKNLPITLDLAGAMRKIATTGEPNDPEVAFRNCLFKMGDGVKDKNLGKVENWGNKALEIAQSTGIKSFQGTAYVTYAGMLLSFKGNELKAENLLNKGLKAVRPAADNGDEICKHLVVQIMATHSACCIHNKEKQKAIDWSIKQGTYANKEKMFLNAMGAFRLGAIYANNVNKHDKKDCIIEAYKAGNKLSKKEKEFSEFRFVALDCFELYQIDGKKAEADKISQQMTEIFGAGWEKEVRKQANAAKSTPDTIYS